MKTYGPYEGKDGRYRLVVVHEDGRIQTISYPRQLMEAHLGRALLPDEDVHHKDEDVSNNNIENLEVVIHSEHCRKHSLKYTESVEVQCVYCGGEFLLTPKRQSQRARDAKRGKFGPFCSRSCSGKYASGVQRAVKQECLG